MLRPCVAGAFPGGWRVLFSALASPTGCSSGRAPLHESPFLADTSTVPTRPTIIAAGRPSWFREKVAKAGSLDVGQVLWASDIAGAGELLLNTNPGQIQAVYLSRSLKESDARAMTDLVSRWSPTTTVAWWSAGAVEIVWPVVK